MTLSKDALSTLNGEPARYRYKTKGIVSAKGTKLRKNELTQARYAPSTDSAARLDVRYIFLAERQLPEQENNEG